MYSSSHQQPTTLSEKPSNPISGGDSSGASAPAQQPASSGLKHSTLKELEMEFSLLRVPLEMANREFRSSQKSVEKDLGILEKAVREMIQKATKQNVSAQDQSIFLDKVVTKLRGVKRKLEETDVLETNYLNNCRERLDHLEQYPVITGAVSRRKSISNITEHEYQLLTGWRRTRVNRVVVDYLLRFGHYETALALSEREHIKHLVDIEVFSRVKHVIESLMKKECSEALKWCSENRSRLRKISSNLEFNLRIQEFIELSKKDKKVEAIVHARKYLTSSQNDAKKNTEEEPVSLTPEQTNMVKKVMASLVFGPSTPIPGYKELYEDSRWNELIEQFKADNYQLHGLTREPTLFMLLRAGLSALKTPHSYEESSININDPLSNELFREIAKDLPFAHHHHSKLVCRITGDIMDDNNPPMVLPNQNVYSLKGLEELAKKNNGLIVDPRGGQTYTLSDAKKLFIM